MSKLHRAVVDLSLVLVGLLLIVGPGSSSGTLNAALIFGPDDNLDPAYKYTGWYLREAGIYETLFAYDTDMNLVPELAKGFDQISDTEYRIALKDGVHFHDGSLLDADAVVFSLKRALDPSNARSMEYDFIDSIAKYDQGSITITTKVPYAPLIASLTDPLLSIVPPSNSQIDRVPIGTGPFRFDSYKSGVRLDVVRNDGYWGQKADLDGARLNFVSDPITRSLQLQGGDVDIARGIPQTEVGALRSSGLGVQQKMTLRTYFMYVNMRKAPFDDIRVRHALNYAINRQELVDTALEGLGGVAATGVFSSVLPWSVNDQLKGYPFDPDRARDLFEQAGISDTDGDGWLEHQGEPFHLTIKTYTKRPELKPSAEVVAAQLRSAGVRADVEILESGALSADLKDGNYDLSLYAWNTAPTGDPDYFLSKHFESTGTEAGYTGYSNTDVDAWIAEGRTAFDQQERRKHYAKVQEQVLADSPEIFLFYLNELVGLGKDVHGYEIYPNEVTFLTSGVNLGSS